jgi:hypothetical protein
LLDFEQATAHQIVVRATDWGGAFSDQRFTIAVQNTDVENPNGSTSADVLFAGPAADTIAASGGNDAIVGGGGDDTVDGGDGTDFVFGAGFAVDGSYAPGSGADRLAGGEGDNGLWGGDGGNRLAGGLGMTAWLVPRGMTPWMARTATTSSSVAIFRSGRLARGQLRQRRAAWRRRQRCALRLR